MFLRDTILVLRREPFSRTSLRLECWSARRGPLALVARGVMRPRNNRLGDVPCVFDVARSVYLARPAGGRALLVDYAVLRSLRQRLEAPTWEWLSAVAVLREALAALWGGYPVDAAEGRRVFLTLWRLHGMLGRMEPFWWAVAGSLRLLVHAGLAPNLDRCAGCGRRLERAVLSMREEGLYCPSCRPKGEVVAGRRVLDFLRLVARDERRALRANGSAGPVVRLLRGWFSVTIGSDMRAFEMLSPPRGRT